MMWTLAHRRADGSFVVYLASGLPYHVTASDLAFADVAAAAEGVDLPDEAAPQTLPEHARNPSPREFMDRVPMARQAEITAAAVQSPAVLLWLLRMLGASEVDPDHPETIAGVNALLNAGVITQGEAVEFLA